MHQTQRSHGSDPQPPKAPPVRRIIKLGGAAVTHKAQLETLQADVLHRVCHSLATKGGEDGGQGFQTGGTVLVHGAGSFGHHPASEYGVARGPLTDPRVRRGFALTRASVARLNGLVVESLVAAGAPAVGLSPLSIYSTRNREVSRSGADAVADCLRSGLLPVLHGDAVLDEQLGCTILSGDTLVRDLAERLRPQFVVFLTNVAGVYDRPPEEEGARLLRRIVVRRDGSWRVAEAEGPEAPAAATSPDGIAGGIRMTADAHDVTGGIALKVEEAARVARLGVPVLIARAGSEDGDAACRLGPEVAALGGRGGGGGGGGRDAGNEGTGGGVVDATAAAAGAVMARGGSGAEGQVEDAGPSGLGGGCGTGGAAWRGTLVVLEDE